MGDDESRSGLVNPVRPRGRAARPPAPLALVALLALVAAVVAGCGDGDEDGRGLRGRRAAGADAEAVSAAEASGAAGEGEGPGEWTMLGRDLANSRTAAGESAIGPDTVADLGVSWETGNLLGVTGTPVVADGVVYVGDWTGHVRALDAATGEARWDTDLDTAYVGGALALDDDHVYAGTREGHMVALDREAGEPVWDVDVGNHPSSVVFGSPVPVDGLVVVGVGSHEVFTGGDSPTFRGHIVALDATTGEEAWRFYVTRGDATEAPGVSVWSSPAVDVERGHVYIGTGQAYGLPAPPRSDALLALDLRTGEEVWARQFTAGDAWTLANPTGLDADVGAPPNLFTVDGADAVGVGDKDGVYRALDRETGEVLWEHRITPGGLQGGVMASAAVEGGHIYVSSNDASTDADLVALEADTGEELWRTEVGAHVTGPVTWANGVVFLADDSGRIAAYDAEDGERLWAYTVAAPAAGGIAVVDGVAYGGFGWWLASRPPDPVGGLIAFAPGAGEPGDGGDGGGGGGGDGAASGEEVYRQSCASCHGGAGEGASGPSLVGVADRLSREGHVAVVLEGRGEMPGWEGSLTPEEVEAVVDYERESLGR
jgi:polyvinyl alcohol dehydrogenase (cytochrome)